ncbi:coenzyme F420-0:L-glutamate ligase [Candidatus Peribacteria bacterium]|nr:coenzyme F420-0:L-glutamate ligase [Candidatus Peribacteria bacterium]
MLILPIRTGLLRAGSDLAKEILSKVTLERSDIVVVSSKAIATVEGAAMNLSEITPSPEAISDAKRCNQDPRFTECILREMKRMNGFVTSTSPFVLLTSLKPEGMKTGRILCPNAGMDLSNTDMGFAIGWPKDPVTSAEKLRATLHVPVIISDSCSRPSRLGVTAFALACTGIDPLQSEVGKSDLFGKKMLVTVEAIADQLATAANAVMGNAAQCIPAAVIRDHGVPFSNFCGWVDGIEEGVDMFASRYAPSKGATRSDTGKT